MILNWYNTRRRRLRWERLEVSDQPVTQVDRPDGGVLGCIAEGPGPAGRIKGAVGAHDGDIDTFLHPADIQIGRRGVL